MECVTGMELFITVRVEDMWASGQKIKCTVMEPYIIRTRLLPMRGNGKMINFGVKELSTIKKLHLWLLLLIIMIGRTLKNTGLNILVSFGLTISMVMENFSWVMDRNFKVNLKMMKLTEKDCSKEKIARFEVYGVKIN